MDNGSTGEISIADLIKLMLSKLWLIILLFVLGGVSAFCVSEFVLPPQYESYTTMYVKNNNSSQAVVSAGDLSTAKSLVSTYIAILKSDTIMEEVGKSLLKEYGEETIAEVFPVTDGAVSTSSLKNSLTMSAVDNTEVMKISAVTTDAEISAALCRAIAKLAPDFLIRVVGAGSVETIDEAQVKKNPVSPNVPKNTLIGAIAGALLACAIIFLMDFFDNTVKNPEHLSEKYKIPILGEIHDIEENKKSHVPNYYLITDNTTPFYVTESYKTMRTNLIFSLSTSDKKIIAVSSAMPSEGKSTTAANMAIALSQLSNNKILLIDGDMRKPVQHRNFGLKNSSGLSTILGKMANLEECIQVSVMENLDIMTAGTQPPNPAELLGSEQMKVLLNQLSKQYNYIIIDMPPLNVVSDALAVSQLVGGMVFVVKHSVTTSDDIDQVIRKAELSKMKLLGFAVTRIKRKNSGNSYYYKKYHNYGGYGYGNSNSSSNNE